MKKFSRALAWLLAVVMILGMLPATFAAEKAEPIEVLNADEAIDPTIPIFENPQYSFAERAADLVARMTLSQKASEITSQSAPAISAGQLGGGALNVPATKGIGGYTWWSETLHGTRGGVNYPQNTTVASTWNPDLYYQEATNIGQEIRERNNTNLNFYSPTINMHRDPRWGRNEESYSEDVYLTAQMGTAWVQGLEGKDRNGVPLDPDGYLMAHSTIKHYVANNNEGSSSGDTTGRLRAGAIGSLRALREYYALPYGEIIRGSDVSSVMTAYSYYGVAPGQYDPSSYSSYLMDTLLREVYGFDGHITGDCDSVNSMQNLNYINPRTGKVLTAPEAFAGALAHGEDLECNGGHSSPGSGTSGFKTTYGAQMSAMMGIETDKGTFTENTVDIALHRLMTARIETGDLDGNIQIKQDASARNSNNLRDTVRRPLVEQINREGIVMLQNKDGFLPLNLSADGISSVAIVGSWQTNGSTGLYAQASGNQQNIQAGIQAAFNAKKSGINYTLITSNSLTDANRTAIAAADVAIVVTGTSSSYSQEDHDRTTIALPDNQEALINNVAAANPNTVVIMETCGPMRVNRFQDNVKAILWSSFGGQWKNGFGDIMAGYCPSGKVTDTWYNEVNNSGESDVPAITDYELFPAEGKNGRTYMYYNGSSAPSYPFGYGLSYTTFEYSDLTIDKTAYDANETVKASFKVKNTGSVAGKEVTELFIAQPDAPAALRRPIKRLEGFQKIDLEPGETKTVEMEIKIEDLAFFDEAADCFLVDTGRYQVQVGTNSRDISLTKDFNVSGALTETPAVVTLKPNQSGDKALGIEQRLIFGKNKEVDPQITVSMNNEKLYGYIIKEQLSSIKQMKSCDLPEGMKVTYTSNRPSVVRVEDGKVYTGAPGVATLSATVEYNGETATGEAVIYVMTNTDVDNITVDGEQIAKFSPTKYKYSMTLENKSHIPVIAAESENPDLEVTVEQATELPGVATITAKDKDSNVASTYTITFKVKASAGGGSTSIDFASVADSGKYEIVNQSQSDITDDGLPLIATTQAFEDCKGQLSGDQATTPVDVVKVPVSGDAWTATLEVDFDTNGAANGYYQFFGFYGGSGEEYENLVGIRGGDGAMQNFIREDGTITHQDEDGVNSAPGFASVGTYFLRIEKAGTTYTCYRSDDGEDFTEMFSYEDTGIESEYIVIDAYTGMTQNYKFTLKKLDIEGVGGAGLPNIDFTTIADSGKYEIVNPVQSDVEEGEGLALIATTQAFEDCKGQLSGDQAITPADLVKVPVGGDWTATLETDFDTNGAANGYYQFFGFYAAQGDDFQNLAGIRGGDGAMQNFIREDGTITHQDEDGVNSAPGFASVGTYFLRIEKSGTTYTCYRSDDGEDFTEMFAYEDTGIEAEYIVIDAYTGMTQNYKFTLKSLAFEGGQGGGTEVALPEVSAITVNGEDIGFDPAVSAYNISVAADGKAPVVAATAGNKDTKIAIEQLTRPTGIAVVTATAGTRTKTYKLAFNYELSDDYFADGDYDAAKWTVINPNEATVSVEKGKGIVMPTQTGNIYQNGSGWYNCFTTPAMGNWEAVVKVFYPVIPFEDYQQAQVLFWQDDDNHIRLNLQYLSQNDNGVVIEPGVEANGTFTAQPKVSVPAAADGSATLYFKFKKDGTTVTGAYSLDGMEYTDVLTAENINYIDPQLALFSSMNQEGNQIDTCYEYVRVVAVNGLQPELVEMLNWAAQNAADYIAADLPAETDSDLVLNAPHGYTVTLNSSDPSVIAADGKVTPAAEDKTVDLTVTVSEGAASGSATAKVKVLAAGSQPIVNKEALEAAIAAAEAVDTSKYTDESVAAMQSALNAARAARNSASQSETDAATDALNAAVAALVEKDVGPVEPVYHTVTFDYNFTGAPDPVTVQVEDGKTVEAIEAPARDGYVFSFWGTRRSGGWGGSTIRQYNFETPVTADLTLLASWSKDWSQTYSLAEEYRDFFPFGNFGTMSPSTTQVNQVTWEYNTYSGNSGKMTYNFGENESKAAYDAAVAEINARTDIDDATKAALIKDADGKVLLNGNNPLASSLNNIRAWNEAHPEGPKKVYRQHVLFWHGSEQNPAFYHEGFDRNKPLVSKEVMNARIDSYVEQMFKRYQEWDDVILSWDVVNEALDDYTGMVRNGWNGSSWGETQLDDASNQSSAWGTIYRMKDAEGNPVMEQSEERLMYESEWIRQAFASARKWQKELGVHWTLYYNDYMNSSMLYEPKMTNTLKMLKPISEAGNLDGYGMQARLSTAYPDAALLRNQIEEGLKLAPEVSFSEGDVRTDFEVNPLYDPDKPTRRVQEGDEEYDEGGSGSWSRRSQQNGNTYDVSNGPVRRRENFNANDPDIMREQADYYADLMDIMLEKADLGKVGAIAIDGTSDGNTFNRNTGCQIWDSSSNEKPAFYAVIGAPNRFKMGKAIEAGPARSEQSKYTPETWIPYAAALKAAEDLVDVRIYDAAGVEAVKAATAALIEATENLRLSGSGPIPEDLEELYRLVLDALARAQAAQKAAEDALKAAQDAAAYDTAALEAAAKAAQDAAKAAQDAAKAAEDAAKAAAESDADAVAKALAAAESAANAADSASEAALAYSAAQRAQAAAEAAKAAAQAAQASTAADKTAAAAAQKAAEDAQAAAEAAQAAAEASDSAAAANAAKAAAQAANAAKAAEAAQVAQQAAEEAEAAAKAAQAKADEAAAQAGSDRAAAEAAKAAAEAAKKAAEAAQKAADDAKDAANKSNADAAKAAADAAEAAAKVADAHQKVADAQAEIAALKAKTEQSAADAAAIQAAAEAAKKAAEEAELGAAKYYAKAELAAAAAKADVPVENKDDFAAAVAAGLAAIEGAEKKADVDKALADALEAIEAACIDDCPSKDFTDVPPYGNWAHAGIDYCVANGLMNGIEEGIFAPNSNTTRAQFTTILYRAANEPEVEYKGVFADVPDGKWYSKAIEWAAANGIVNGVSEDKFNPEGKITREQIAAILYRYSDSPKVDGKLEGFRDADDVSNYAVDAMIWAVSEGIIKGVGEGETVALNPKANATRAQIATIFARFLAE